MPRPEYDVVVVGSGAAGGMAAHELSRAGAKVLMLEAGPALDLEKDFFHHRKVYEFPHRNALPKRERAAYCYAANPWDKQNFVGERDDPYTGPEVGWGRSALAPRPHTGRPPCHYCGHCDRVCDVRASFSSLGVLIPPALATGKLTIRPNALVHTVTVDKNNRATGVAFVDRLTRRHEE